MDVREIAPGDDAFEWYVDLFDRYRAEYGQAADPDRSRAWLTDAMTTGPMRGFLASVDGVAAGICLIAIATATHRRGEGPARRGASSGPTTRCAAVDAPDRGRQRRRVATVRAVRVRAGDGTA
jgi:hypothetical protein